MDQNNPIIERSALCFEALTIRFVPGRGVLADSFPPKIAIRPEMLFRAKTHPGVIAVNGAGGLGTAVTFTLANGEAVYEVTDYAVEVGTGNRLLVADRRAFKLKIAGRHVEVKTFGLRDLNKLADSWPEVAAFAADVVNAPVDLRKIVRMRNRDTAPQLVFDLGGARAWYAIMMKHINRAGDTIYIAERARLRSADGTWIRLPTAAAVGRAGFSIFN